MLMTTLFKSFSRKSVFVRSSPAIALTRPYSVSSTNQEDECCLIEKNEMEDFMFRCMTTVGAKEAHAKSLASCLITGDVRGHFSHGLNRLDMYVRDVKAGTTCSKNEPLIRKETPASAFVDGNNLLGPVVGNFCMKLAIEKAKTMGIGMVVANRSNHYGIAGYYSQQALESGMIGMSMTNTSPLTSPTRSKTRTFGTNPIAFAAPAKKCEDEKDKDSFQLDMATSTVAFGKVELQHRKGAPIPSTWGADSEGRATTNPKEVMTGGSLLPLGGVEETGGYKGYGLMFMVDTLCGVLSGSRFGPNVRTWQTSSGEADLGQCFIAINPEHFADNFDERLQSLIDHCRQMPPVDESKPVLVHGDPEKSNIRKSERDGGISYHLNQLVYAQNLAKELSIQPPKVVEAK